MLAKLAIILIVLIIPLSPILQANGAEVEVKIERDSVTVQVGTNIYQNLTGILPSWELPRNVRSVLIGENATEVTRIFQNAVSAISPRAQVSNLVLHVNSSSFPGCQPDICPLQWFNITARFGLSGVSQNQGSVLKVDTSWKSFGIDENIIVANLEVNRIGDAYLLDAVDRLLQIAPDPRRVFRTELNRDVMTRDNYRIFVPRVTALDLRGLSLPVESWTRSLDFEAPETSWQSPISTGFNVTGIGEVFEPEETIRLVYKLEALSTGKITAPRFARALENAVLLENPGLSETDLFLVIVVSSIVLFAATSLIERRILRGQPRKRR